MMNHGEAIGLTSTHEAMSDKHPEVTEEVVRMYLEARTDDDAGVGIPISMTLPSDPDFCSRSAMVR